jgi:hypothetical protein
MWPCKTRAGQRRRRTVSGRRGEATRVGGGEPKTERRGTKLRFWQTRPCGTGGGLVCLTNGQSAEQSQSRFSHRDAIPSPFPLTPHGSTGPRWLRLFKAG